MIRRFFIALQFLTRLPVPRSLNSSESDIGKAAAFFPLVGIIVGGAAALVFIALQRILPLSAAVLCAVIFAAFLTNGFHEDGLADSFDGFTVEYAEIRDLGDRLLAIGQLHTRGNLSGVVSETPYAILADYRGGKMTRSRTYLDAQEALDAAGLSE